MGGSNLKILSISIYLSVHRLILYCNTSYSSLLSSYVGPKVNQSISLFLVVCYPQFAIWSQIYFVPQGKIVNQRTALTNAVYNLCRVNIKPVYTNIIFSLLPNCITFIRLQSFPNQNKDVWYKQVVHSFQDVYILTNQYPRVR